MSKEEKSFQKTSINWYPGHMAKTKREIKEKINLIDVVYELIDARMPLSSKIKDIDEYTKNKKRLLIMTKKDLCDYKITQKWVKYYESLGYKVILADLKNSQDIKLIIKTTKELMLTKNKQREEKGLKEKDIKVLVMGIPNVGKSTLINALVGKKVTLTANKPGVTKNITWLKTNNGLSLLDTPGILWPKLEEKNSYALASMLAVKTDVLDISEVGMYILNFLKNNYPNILKEKYNLDKLDKETLELAEDLALKMGFIKNGEVDYDKVFLRIYHDLANELIKGVTFDYDI